LDAVDRLGVVRTAFGASGADGGPMQRDCGELAAPASLLASMVGTLGSIRSDDGGFAKGGGFTKGGDA